MKKITGILLILALLFGNCITTYAHTIYNDDIILKTFQVDGKDATGSESIGWGVFEQSHLGTYKATYRFDSSVDSLPNAKSRFNNGAKLWSDNTDAQLTYTTDTNDNITLRMRNSSDDALNIPNTSIAFTKPKVAPNSNGHSSKWEIVINKGNYTNKVVFAHEIGHVFGLVDLHNSNNIDKLMYYSNASTAEAPTESDIKGFKFITGLHTSHSWVYTSDSYRKCSGCGGISTYKHPYTWTDYNSSLHKGSCAHCNQTLNASHTKDTFVNESSTQHKSYCKCGRYRGLDTHTKDKFKSQNAAQHKVYCKCGQYRGLENHTPNSTNTKCTQCGYTGVIGGTVALPDEEE